VNLKLQNLSTIYPHVDYSILLDIFNSKNKNLLETRKVLEEWFPLENKPEQTPSSIKKPTVNN